MCELRIFERYDRKSAASEERGVRQNAARRRRMMTSNNGNRLKPLTNTNTAANKSSDQHAVARFICCCSFCFDLLFPVYSTNLTPFAVEYRMLLLFRCVGTV